MSVHFVAVAIALLLLYVAVAEAVQAFAGGEARLSHVASAAVRDALIAGGGHRKGAYAALTKESDAPPRRASTLPSPARSEFRRLLKVALDVKRAYPFLRNAQYLKDGSRLLRVAALVTEAAANLTHAPPGGAAAPPRGRPDAAGPPQRVRAFEVGGGFGLLAMAAARGGVAAVVVEPEAAARALAAAVVRRSGLAGRVAVVGGWGAVGAQAHALCWALLYPALPLPVAHAPTRALVRGVMPAVREAARRLAPACAAVRWLPAEIRVWAQVVEFRGPKSTTLAPFHIRNASGFDVSLLNAHRRHLPAHADLSTGGTARLSPPFVVAVLEPPALPRLAGSAALTLDPWEGPWDVGLAIWSEAAGEGPRASGPGRRFARQEVHLFDVGGDCAARPRRPVRAVVTWQPAAWAGGLEFAMAAGACRWRPLPRRAGPSGPARWHVPMLLDWRRNAFYDEGMRRQLRDAACAPSGCRVLDIGAGSGLLGMMLYRAGARHVAFIERDRETALAAYRIVRANFPRAVVAWGNATDAVGLVAGSRSQGPDFVMLHMDSAELLLPPELRFDVLISEIFDTALFGEGVLKTVRQARDRLLVPGARIFPPRADLLAQVVSIDDTKPSFGDIPFPANLSGFDLTPLNVLRRAPYTPAWRDNPLDYANLSAVHTVFAIDFERQPPPDPLHVALSVGMLARGRANAVIAWFVLHAPSGLTYETSWANPESCWGPALFVLGTPHDVAVDSTWQLRAQLTEENQLLSFALSKPED